MEIKKEKTVAHSLLDKATKEKVADCTPFLGYIGESSNDKVITLYRDVLNPSDTMEISKEDIVHLTEAPKEVLPFDGIIVWVKDEASIFSKRTVKFNPKDVRRVGRLTVGLSDRIHPHFCFICRPRCFTPPSCMPAFNKSM